ncbi:MAG: hypothetical protein ACOX81_03395 [Candidatus Heteroscillospira sp.]|jgi:protein-S-isoprenylcysteine O-methyltransferase Ste14
MLYVLLACLSFGPLYLFDALKLRGGGRYGWLFLLGCAGILAGTVGAFFTGAPRFILPGVLPVICGAMTLVFAGMLLWALFFSLPFERTYVEGISGTVVNTGLYALCRHPGVLFFAGMYICAWLVSGRDAMLICSLCLILCDLLHVWIQDRYYFPKTLAGYGAYCLETPFLIPNTASVRRCFATLHTREARVK